MSCAAPIPARDICPTKAEIVPQLLALLPRGRAWARHDGGPFPGSIAWQFWSALAALFEFANQRMCDLRREFFCATLDETRDVWMADYGLPDGCDPYPDLCVKVAALGGTSCAFYTAIAAAAGWDVSCVARSGRCGASVGALGKRARAGCMQPGQRTNGTMVILVRRASSPAYVAPVRRPAKAGRLCAGQRLACGPDISPVVCLIERIVHAEVEVTYEVV